MRRHPDSVHAKLGKTEALPCKKELLSLLKWAGVSLQLVNLLNCNVWHDA
jgi:hypothetical protein